jgi:hypothetical protein
LTELREVVVNAVASIGGDTTIYGTLDAFSATLGAGASVTGVVTTSPTANTFVPIIMPTATVFTAGGADQTVDSGLDQLTLAPGTYGMLATSQQNQTVNLSSGNYYFDAIDVQGGFTLKIDLTSGDPINIYVVGNVDFNVQDIKLEVKGAGTGGLFVPISDAQDLAALIYLETLDTFDMGGENLWGGTVYASLGDVNIGQYIDWYGAVFAFDSVDIADHGSWYHVPLAADQTPIPEPTTMFLLGIGMVGFCAFGRSIRRKN